jgi:uncharacterized metal-binding protein
MYKTQIDFSLAVEGTTGCCPIGEKWGTQNIQERMIPVISCEGACIRGEIARVAANMVGRVDPFRRSCHGEMFTVPGSAIAQWMTKAEKVVVIDGCFLHCHGRVMKNLVGEEQLVLIDALSVYKKYTDIFDIDDVPEADRREAARQVADKVISGFGKGSLRSESIGCCLAQPTKDCCQER